MKKDRCKKKREKNNEKVKLKYHAGDFYSYLQFDKMDSPRPVMAELRP